MFSSGKFTGHFVFVISLGFGLVITTGATLADQSTERLEERRALGFVAAVSSGDGDTLFSYTEENFTPAVWQGRSPDEWRTLVNQLVQRHTGIQVQGVEITQPHNVVVSAMGTEGPRLQFSFDFESDPPHRIAGLGIEAGEGMSGGPELPAFELPDSATEETIGAHLMEYLSKLADQDLFAGAVLVAWQGEPIFQEAYGLASREFQVPNRMDTRFDLGSINKSFTKIAVGQLVERGKLSLDDTIAQHLPEYPNAAVAGQVTIRQLVEHTSGLGDIFTEAYLNTPKDHLRTPRDFFPLFAEVPLEFEPGSRFAYSNAGYMVLGAIIEAVAGMPYDEYVDRFIFSPAGMQGAGFFAKDEPVPNVAMGYTRENAVDTPAGWRNNLFLLPVKGNSAGSAQASVTDLLHFDSALREHVLLSSATTSWFFGGSEPKAGSTFDAQAERVAAGMGIAGGAPGVSAVLESDGDLAVIVLGNLDEPIAETIARAIFKPLHRALDRIY